MAGAPAPTAGSVTEGRDVSLPPRGSDLKRAVGRLEERAAACDSGLAAEPEAYRLLVASLFSSPASMIDDGITGSEPEVASRRKALVNDKMPQRMIEPTTGPRTRPMPPMMI